MNEIPRRYSPEQVPKKFNTINNLYQLKKFGTLKLKQNDVISNSYCNGEEIHFMGLYHHYHSSTNGHVWFEQLCDDNVRYENDRYENGTTNNVTPDDDTTVNGTPEDGTTDNVTPDDGTTANDTPVDGTTDEGTTVNGTTEEDTTDNVTPENSTEFGLITNVASCREKNIYVSVGTFNSRTKALTHIEHDHNIEPDGSKNEHVDEYVYTLHAFSEDGYTWIPAESYDCNYIHKMNVHENSHIIPMNVAYGDNAFVSNVMIRVCNDDGSEERHSCLFYSHDGKNWKYAVYLKHAFNRLIYGNKKFVMVSQDGYSAWSIDGINWNVKPFVNCVNGVNVNEKVDCNITAMYCIGDKYTGIGYLYDDNESYKFNISHKTFMDQLMKKMDNNDLNSSDIVYNFIINCMRTRVFYSDDGETWYVTDKYVMKKEMYDEYERYLLRLPKSILKFMIYHISVLSEHVNTITEKNGKFITTVAPYNVVLYSDDGKEWHIKQTLSEYMTIEKHESFGYETYVGFALDGEIYCSIDCENWYRGKVYTMKKEGKE